jgi:hypothetical protein
VALVERQILQKVGNTEPEMHRPIQEGGQPVERDWRDNSFLVREESNDDMEAS